MDDRTTEWTNERWRRNADARLGIGAIPRGASIVVGVATVVVLTGWASGNPTLASFARGGVTMKVNTALGLLFGAISLWFLADEDAAPWSKWIGRASAGITASIGVVTLGEYAGGIRGGIDQLVFDATWDAAKTATPGRMAASTAAVFVILAAALLTLDVTVRRIRLSQLLTIVGSAIPLTTLLGYSYSVIPLVGLGQGLQMAVHTAVGFLLLDAGLFAARPRAGIMQTLASHRAGGVLARRVLPYAFVVPIALGALRILGESAGLYSNSQGSALASVITMFVLIVLIWHTARDINQSDKERERAFSALSAEHHARLNAESARAQAESAERRLAIVAEASQLLSSSFDSRVILERLAGLTVPTLADWCFVDVLAENGMWQRVAIAHANADEGIDIAAKFRRQFRRRPNDRYAGLSATRTTHIPFVTEDLLQTLAQDDEHLALLRELDMRSYVTVPLSAHDTVLGAITFIRSTPRDPYTVADIALLEELGRRGSTAIDNARLYQGALAGAQTKVEFLATISHELRTPLTAIMGYTALLEDGISGPLTPMQDEHIGHVRDSADHLLELIDDILTFSKLEAGRVKPNAENVIVADALEEAARLVAPLAEQRGLELTVERPQELMIIETDAVKLRQILVNLLNNAVKFTERGSVKLRAWNDVHDVVFEVRDTGIGMSDEDVEHIFEAFTQVDQRLTRKVGGLGLGLGVAQRLSALLGGEISVASRKGRGSTFYVRIPVSARATPAQQREA